MVTLAWLVSKPIPRRWKLNYVAQSGSEHIEFLVKNKLFDLAPSSILDTAYAVESSGVSVRDIEKELDGLRKRRDGLASPAAAPQQAPERMLLSRKGGALIAQCLGIPELGPEIERAVWQVERAIQAGKELAEEKAELEQANSKR